jgi:hypothetical protein
MGSSDGDGADGEGVRWGPQMVTEQMGKDSFRAVRAACNRSVQTLSALRVWLASNGDVQAMEVEVR